MDNNKKKPTLYQLRLRYGLNIYDLSRAANTSSYSVWRMLTGQAVSRQEAEHIVTGLNRLQDTHFTLADVDVVLEDEAHDEEK